MIGKVMKSEGIREIFQEHLGVYCREIGKAFERRFSVLKANLKFSKQRKLENFKHISEIMNFYQKLLKSSL